MTPSTPHAVPHAAERAAPGAHSAHHPVAALVGVLQQLREVVLSVTDEQYTATVSTISGAMGAHLRHCLEHVEALVTCVGDGMINYDRRSRGSPVEYDRRAAADRVASLLGELRAVELGSLEQVMNLSVLFAAGTGPVQVRSSLGRELAFVLSHTIHHQAMIASMVQALGGVVPERFGYAPATIEHLAATHQS